MRPLFACALIGATISVASGQTVSTPYAFSTLAGRAAQSGTTDGVGANARFNRPWGITVDALGNVYVADSANYTVRKITTEGVVSTIAGQPLTSGTLDGPIIIAQFGTIVNPPPSGPIVAGPFGLAVAATGNIFVADTFSNTIRQIDPTSRVSTYSGAANSGGFEDGPVAAARFKVPWGIAMDAGGVIYVADTYNHVIRRISTAGKVVATIAGMVGDWGNHDGIGATARFFYPTGIAVDPYGKLYVTDSSNTVRRISRSALSSDLWEVTTLAGTAGTFGSTDGTGPAARFGAAPSTSPNGGIVIRYAANSPGIPPIFDGFSYSIDELPGIAADGAGNVFVSDYANNSIRMISAAGVVTTIAGSSSIGSTDGIGANVRFIRPTGIAVDGAGNVYAADSQNHTIRKGALAAAPAIQSQPEDQSAGFGANVTLTVVATGAPTPTYQWRRDGISIGGATAATLTLSNVQAAQAGTYSVVVTNVLGSVTTTPARLSVVNSPVINTQPLSQSVPSGQTVILTVNAAGSPPPTLQWYRDGVPVSGETNSSLVLPGVQQGSAGDYFVLVTNSAGVVTSNIARVAVNTGRIVNLSIRTSITGSEVLIVGFVSTGGPKPLLVRAVGPTLRSFGVGGAMADPQLSLHNAGVITATNDNWGSGAAVGQLTLAASQVGAFSLPGDSLDAAVLATSLDNAMTAQTSSRNNAGGVVLIELYDTTPTGPSRLINVSARAKVGGGENALFAGFVVSGGAAKTLLIRAVGPTLGAFGVSGVLNDPRLDIFASGASIPLASNDNWGGNVALTAAFRSVAAFSLPANESKDAALLVSLAPGAYSAQVSGVGGLTGEVLLEIYEIP